MFGQIDLGRFGLGRLARSVLGGSFDLPDEGLSVGM